MSKDLRERAAEAAEIVDETDGRIRVVSHYDADGLSAAAIVARALRRADKAFQLSIARRLTQDVVDRVADEGDLHIFADMGSGDPELFDGIAEQTIVLDHHVPEGEGDFAAHVNAHLGGYDGTFEACAGSVAFLWATQLSEDNWDLFPIAVAGIVGDRQAHQGVSGLNQELAAEAGKRGVVEQWTGPRLPPGTLAESISASTDPFFVGLTGDKQATRDFLEDLGVDPDVRFQDLGEEARRTATSALVARLLDQGCLEETVRELVGPRWRFDFRGIEDAGRLAGLLNAAGRFDRVGDGLGFLLGQPDVREGLVETMEDYHGKVLEEALRVLEEGPDVREAIQVVKVERPHLTGTVCGIAMSFMFDQSKATIAYRIDEDDEKYKISARGTRKLVDAGLDLAEGCRKAADRAGGSGGGHTIAAGAAAPLDDGLEPFLATIDEIVDEQLEGSS